MAQPYIGEIRIFGGNFAPSGWAFCNGQILPISENEALFQLIGTTYGGDGQETFGLPDLQGRAPIHMGGGFVISQNGGVEQVTLTVPQIPSHTHPAQVAAAGDSASPTGNYWSTAPGASTALGNTAAGAGANIASMAATAVGSAGGSQPHENMQPFLGISYIISLFGIFPSQN
jgi:microcystin-dependent protein